MRRLILNLHLYGALIAGIFVVVIGTTGSILAFEPELDRWLNPGLFRVTPRARPLPVAELFRAAARAYPGQRIGSLRLPQSADDSAQFGVRGPRQVFIDPYTGAILGERGSQTALAKIHQIHLRLLMTGETGRSIVFYATCVLLFLVISGLYLWWPAKRAGVKWSGGARRVFFDLHNTAGIYSALFLLVLGSTGIAVHFDNRLEDYLHQRAGTRKIGRNIPPAAARTAAPIDADQAIEAALRAMPGTQALTIVPPANAKSSFLVALHFPEDRTPGGRSWVNVDPYSGQALSQQNSRTVAAATRTIIWNRAIHTGDVYGLASKTLMSLSSLMLVIQVITGYGMWWKKIRRTPKA